MKTEVTEHYGRVTNGVIVLEEPEALPEGTLVRITPVRPESTLGQGLLRFAGTIEGLPLNMATNYDYYIHRTPKE
jgi:hypothetical protein